MPIVRTAHDLCGEREEGHLPDSIIEQEMAAMRTLTRERGDALADFIRESF